MRLEPLFTIRADLVGNHAVGDFGRGTRAVAVVGGGSFEGEKLRGEVLTPGADWLVTGSKGHGQVDVRLVLKTDDAVLIYMVYTGVLEMNEKIGAAIASGGETALGDAYFVTQIRFECGDERYDWLNHLCAVGEGRLIPGGVEYEVHGCIPG